MNGKQAVPDCARGKICRRAWSMKKISMPKWALEQKCDYSLAGLSLRVSLTMIRRSRLPTVGKGCRSYNVTKTQHNILCKQAAEQMISTQCNTSLSLSKQWVLTCACCRARLRQSSFISSTACSFGSNSDWFFRNLRSLAAFLLRCACAFAYMTQDIHIDIQTYI